jgi:hypothetical protein
MVKPIRGFPAAARTKPTNRQEGASSSTTASAAAAQLAPATPQVPRRLLPAPTPTPFRLEKNPQPTVRITRLFRPQPLVPRPVNFAAGSRRCWQKWAEFCVTGCGLAVEARVCPLGVVIKLQAEQAEYIAVFLREDPRGMYMPHKDLKKVVRHAQRRAVSVEEDRLSTACRHAVMDTMLAQMSTRVTFERVHDMVILGMKTGDKVTRALRQLCWAE